jgi:hypothetical protein
MNEAHQDYDRQIEVTNNHLVNVRARPASPQNQQEIVELQSKVAELTEQMDRIRAVLAYMSRFTARWNS